MLSTRATLGVLTPQHLFLEQRGPPVFLAHIQGPLFFLHEADIAKYFSVLRVTGGILSG